MKRSFASLSFLTRFQPGGLAISTIFFNRFNGFLQFLIEKTHLY